MFYIIYLFLSSFYTLQEDATNFAAAPPVKVTVFYESLCPYSIDFLVTQLQPVFESLANITIIDIYAYGNVEESFDAKNNNYVFECQHGPRECLGNKVLECAKKYIPDHDKYLKFAFCVMSSEHPPEAGRKCSHNLGIAFHPIMRCSSTEEGNEIFHKVGDIQKKMAPELEGVPWILINQKYNEKDEEEARSSLLQLICRTYKGTKPNICHSS